MEYTINSKDKTITIFSEGGNVEEIKAIMAPPKDFRKGSGDFSIVGMNPDNYNNASLLMDMAQARDELIQSHGIEVAPMIPAGVFAIDDVVLITIHGRGKLFK
jgi:hypothetical protein